MEEMIAVLDENGKKTGKIKTKQQIKKDGDYHQAISVCILNEKKEILLQRRSKNKKIYPNLWSLFVKGHVRAYENTIDACIREVKEELGIFLNQKEFHYLYTIKEEKRTEEYIENIFYDTFLVIKSIDLSALNLEKEEVSEVKYMSYEDLFKVVFNQKNVFVPNYEDYKRIFQILKNIDLSS